MVVECRLTGLARHILLVGLLVVGMASLVDSHGGLAAQAFERKEHLASDRIHLVAHVGIWSGFHLLVLKSVVRYLCNDWLVREARSIMLLRRDTRLAKLGHRLRLLLLCSPYGVFSI